MEREQTILNITETIIGKTVYIVRAIQSDKAKETADDKMKRIICCRISEGELHPKTASL
jgi:hypothetical protein